MKVLLIMNQNSYAGREYLTALRNEGIKTDVAAIGEYPEINVSEEERCGGLWNPLKESELESYFTFHRFKSLKDESFLDFLQEHNYELGIQGGTGILKKNVISKFKYGILNFHPGDLPAYRGCSAPEWQLYENNPVVSTCHLVDEGIDTGKIVSKRILETDHSSYENFRASVYPLTALFVCDIIKAVQLNPEIINEAVVQDEKFAVYRKYIGNETIEILKRRLAEKHEVL